MKSSYFRFYEELNDFLPPKRRKKTFTYSYYGTPSVKDAVESLGVPHAEVDLILVDTVSVDFTFLLKGGEHVSVYPVFESFDISAVHRLGPSPLRTVRFVLDVHLGALCRLLRMLGFDTYYRNDLSDPEIISISNHQKRIILTRDKGILKHGSVTHGYWIRSTDPRHQIREVVKRFDLCDRLSPFTRCMRCNGELSSRSLQQVMAKVPEHVAKTSRSFMQCKDCGRVYWRGTHTQAMEKKIESIRAFCEDRGR